MDNTENSPSALKALQTIRFLARSWLAPDASDAKDIDIAEEQAEASFAVLDKLQDQITPPAGVTDAEIIVFHWTREHGDCDDCGRPAAFLLDSGEEPKSQYCALCAANHAADGDGEISWIEAPE